MTFRFQVYYMEDAYEFLKNLDDKARDKLLYNIERTIHRNDKTLFKKLNDDIWEFRTLYNKISYRLLAFWDKTNHNNTLVIATHGFIKKSEKIPEKEIKKAEQLRAIYFSSKS